MGECRAWLGICSGVVCTAYLKTAARAVAGMGAPSGWCQCLVHSVVNMAGPPGPSVVAGGSWAVLTVGVHVVKH